MLKKTTYIMNSILPDIIELEKSFSSVETDKEKSDNSTEDVQDVKSILSELKENLEGYDLEPKIKKYDFENALSIIKKNKFHD